MANDVAEEYVKDGFSFGVYPRANMTLDEKLAHHDVPALIRVAKKYGLNIDHNSIENGYATTKEPETLTDMKRDIYNGIVSMIMGKNLEAIEFGHANGLLDAESTYSFFDDPDTDGISDPEDRAKANELSSKEFALSYSTSDDGEWNDYHFISFNKYCDVNAQRPW